MKLKDLTGEKFGKWTVQQRVQTNRNHTVWRCICECGNIRDVYSTHLIQGQSKRCSKCAPKGNHHHQWKGFGDISGDYWDSIKRGAGGRKRGSRRSVDFTITIEYAWNLFLKQGKKCALSGQDIIIKYNEQSNHTASLDRIDSSIGYTENNVQWVHKDINMMKRTYDENYFIEMCILISNHSKKNNSGGACEIQ
jgi:hypothetical protein